MRLMMKKLIGYTTMSMTDSMSEEGPNGTSSLHSLCPHDSTHHGVPLEKRAKQKNWRHIVPNDPSSRPNSPISNVD